MGATPVSREPRPHGLAQTLRLSTGRTVGEPERNGREHIRPRNGSARPHPERCGSETRRFQLWEQGWRISRKGMTLGFLGLFEHKMSEQVWFNRVALGLTVVVLVGFAAGLGLAGAFPGTPTRAAPTTPTTGTVTQL